VTAPMCRSLRRAALIAALIWIVSCTDVSPVASWPFFLAKTELLTSVVRPQIGCGLEEDGGLVWTFQARSREESRSWIDAVRAVVASVNPLVHPWGVPGEVACSTLKDALQPRGATDAPVDGEPKISSPFNVQHIASGAAAAVGAAAAAVGVAGSARAGEVDRAHGLSAGSHYKEIETKVLREVTSLHDLTEKDLEEWRDR